jgi:Beta-propeller repeat
MNRLRVGSTVGCVLSLLWLMPACSSSEDATDGEENLGELEQMARKGSAGAMNGQADYCWNTSNPAQLCALGEGDCDADAQCAAPNVCVRNKGPNFGFLGDVCAPAHCGNKIKDGNETQIDCGGSCGTNCPAVCQNLPANGQIGRCTTDCPCAAGFGDCDTNAQCATGNSCVLDIGGFYGFAYGTDMCIATTCTSGTQNGDETGIDCGGSCKPCPGTHVRSANYGSASSDHGEAVAVDTAGNAFMAGRFSGTINFGCGDMTSGGGVKSDVYVVKVSSAGICQWSIQVGSPDGGDGDSGVALDLDTAGNPVIGSNFYTTSNFLGNSRTSAGLADMFVMKLSGSTGAFTWLRNYGSTGIDRVLGLDVDGSNNVYFTGAFAGSVNFGGGALTSAGAGDVAVVKLNSAGTHVWSKRFGGTGADVGYGVSADALGNVYLGGQFAGAVNFGNQTLTSVGLLDGFLLKLNATGTTTAYSKQFGGTSDDLVRDVAADSTGRIVIAGRFKTSVDLGGGVVNAAGIHAFAAAYSNTGAYLWGKTVGGSAASQAIAVTRDNAGNAAIVGYFSGAANFGAGTVNSAGGDDIFILRYSLAGGTSWVARYGGTGSEQALAARFGGGILVLAGRLNGTANFGGSPLTGTQDALLASYVF